MLRRPRSHAYAALALHSKWHADSVSALCSAPGSWVPVSLIKGVMRVSGTDDDEGETAPAPGEEVKTLDRGIDVIKCPACMLQVTQA